jgi:hypothetical protein
MADITFTNGEATKTLPESYAKRMLADGWKKKSGKAATTDLADQLAAAAK